MTRALLVAASFVVLASTVPCFAQDSEEYAKCVKTAASQTAMNVCSAEEARRADVELNEIYKKVLSAARNQPRSVEKIRAAQRAWITFRDAYVDAMYPAEDKQAQYGSTFPMEVDLLRAKLTRQQIGALKSLLTEHGH